MARRESSGRRFPDRHTVRVIYLFAAFVAGYAFAVIGVDSGMVKGILKTINEYIKLIGGLPVLLFLFTVVKWAVDRRRTYNE